MIPKLLREPLVHFLVLGAALYVLFNFAGNRSEPQSGRIVVTSGKIDQMITIFSRTWQRPPTAQELDALIADDVREEVLYREALAMGLDKDDIIVRRRMRQKIEFLTEDTAAISMPADRDLQDWLEKNPDKARIEPKFAFLQVYVKVGRRGDEPFTEATKLLTQLNNAGEKIDPSQLGDVTMLPHEFPLSSTDEITRAFGHEFAQQLAMLESGRWAGPIQSGYGLHLVYVRERTEGRLRPLEEMRNEVQREWMTAHRKEVTEAIYGKLREKYIVVVEPAQPQGRGPLQSGNLPTVERSQ